MTYEVEYRSLAGFAIDNGILLAMILACR